jgi:hypothetical protein
MEYPYYEINHDGNGKYVCDTCDNEDYMTCPGVANKVNALATSSSNSSSSSPVKVKPLGTYAERKAKREEVAKRVEKWKKEEKELKETGKLPYLPPLSD